MFWIRIRSDPEQFDVCGSAVIFRIWNRKIWPSTHTENICRSYFHGTTRPHGNRWWRYRTGTSVLVVYQNTGTVPYCCLNCGTIWKLKLHFDGLLHCFRIGTARIRNYLVSRIRILLFFTQNIEIPTVAIYWKQGDFVEREIPQFLEHIWTRDKFWKYFLNFEFVLQGKDPNPKYVISFERFRRRTGSL